MDIEAAREFIRGHHHAVLSTTRSDGRAQLSPVTVGIDAQGRVELSTRETAVKVRNLRRDPHASFAVFTDAFVGEWVQVEGPAEIVSLPDALEPLVDYYRAISGEHPDWEDYRARMIEQRRVLVRVEIERAGPTISG
jgi:PPOX class probable F420-dependent enzyme